MKHHKINTLFNILLWFYRKQSYNFFKYLYEECEARFIKSVIPQDGALVKSIAMQTIMANVFKRNGDR
ncbi:MAG: hypothetical protein EX341_11675 [Candidatus Scalindua sp. SCAELEC01]|nr:hypothetical protein [Planctomycetota bacterium]RZV77563.1 MAG: hypothetical protein EX341_11675 [Candidatus Scalindua sp. SCAELEC01]